MRHYAVIPHGENGKIDPEGIPQIFTAENETAIHRYLNKKDYTIVAAKTAHVLASKGKPIVIGEAKVPKEKKSARKPKTPSPVTSKPNGESGSDNTSAVSQEPTPLRRTRTAPAPTEEAGDTAESDAPNPNAARKELPSAGLGTRTRRAGGVGRYRPPSDDDNADGTAAAE